MSLYVKKADRKNSSPELANTFLIFLKTKLDIFVKLIHALSVLFHGRKKMLSFNIMQIGSNLDPYSTEALE